MKYYLIGIKGSGLSSLALILNDLGHSVTGYDDNLEEKFTEGELKKRSIKIYNDDSYELTSDLIIIRSTAITIEHPEIIRIKQNNLKIYEYHEYLGELTGQFKTIAIAGCHGKTTTTSMLSLVLNNITGCNYLIGDGHGYAKKQNELFVIEACEHYRHFLAYNPYISIITNVDLDHVGYYQDLNDIKNAYTHFANKNQELIVIYGDSEASRSLKIKNKVLYYGLNDNNDVIAKNIIYHDQGISFDVFIENTLFIHLDLPFFGEHLLLNTLAVVTVCYYLKLKPDEINKNLPLYQGAKRRFQEIKYKDNILIDDYAHHPAEIKATIQAAKQKYPAKKIIVVFRPHHYDRTKMFAKEFAQSLNLADASYILDIWSTDLPEDYPGVTSELITKHLKQGYLLKEDDNPISNYANSVIIFMSPIEIKLFKNLTKK